MRNLFLFLLPILLMPFNILTAQYTESLNANRPGESQGAFSVGTNVLQFEAGFGLGKEDHRLLETETNAFLIDYAVRYGLLKEELEISIIGSFQSNNVTDTRGAIDREFSFSNFRSNTIGAKYLIYDPNRKRALEGPSFSHPKQLYRRFRFCNKYYCRSRYNRFPNLWIYFNLNPYTHRMVFYFCRESRI